MESGALWLSPLVGFGCLSGRWGEEWYGVPKSLIGLRGLFVRLISYLNHIKVNITSLNSQFHTIKSGTQYCGWSGQCGKKPPLTSLSLVIGGPGEWYEPNAQPFNFQDTLESVFLYKRKTTILGISRLEQRGGSRLWITFLNSPLCFQRIRSVMSNPISPF